MLKEFLIYRKVGENIHFLNCSSGKVQSFCQEDGEMIIDNLDKPERLKNMVSRGTFLFLSEDKKRMKPKALRAALLELGAEFSFPTTVNIELNRRCVLRCKHCYIPFKSLTAEDVEMFDKYSIKQIKDLFVSLRNMGVFFVVLTGGEPFLNKNFQNFLNEAQNQGFVVEIFSNLQMIPDWFISSTTKYRINRFQTSIYSILPEVHDRVTNKKGSLKNTLANLRLLKDKGYKVEVASPLMCFNFGSRKVTKEYFEKRHITQSFSWPIVNEYYEGCEGKDQLNINKDQFLEFVDENPDYILCPDFSDKIHICGAGRLLFSISANGDVFPCSQFPKKMGNINESTVEEIMHSNRMCDVACLTPKLIGKKEFVYNFCMGNNYSETGNPLKVPEFLVEMYRHYEKHKQGREVKK